MYKVVIAEDERMIRQGLVALIDQLVTDFEVIGEADNGERALELLTYDCPDVLLTDIRMPKRDGLSLIKEVRTQYPNLPIIIVSGHEEFTYAQKAIQMGVTRYLLKPIERTEMILAFDEVKRSLSQVFTSTSENKMIRQVDSYIQRNIDQEISLQTVAKLVHLHPSYFSQCFKNETGENFSHYVTAKRIHRAEQLLKETNLRVYEVARMSGYQSEKHFMKIFKKVKNCTPSQYRHS
ncbi:response regulator transcription factor [Alkalicoccobacillus porphyridii]|uniref:Response regulator n=1 Tax=Alkalicoccobacillus porphyridii TaxID=2597270 RepID=A0A554A187_9BACI|nr:response regulator [Alkalicoccobacillus porphyridii]TSB47462.1 response regulator [Alkalicoccobacillus porphyridii]